MKRAKQLGNYLMVGLSTDKFNLSKNKQSCIPYQDRKIILESIRYVDFVFTEDSWDQKVDDIKKYNADIFVMGDDWQDKFDDLSVYCQVQYLTRTPKISTNKLKKYVK